RLPDADVALVRGAGAHEPAARRCRCAALRPEGGRRVERGRADGDGLVARRSAARARATHVLRAAVLGAGPRGPVYVDVADAGCVDVARDADRIAVAVEPAHHRARLRDRAGVGLRCAADLPELERAVGRAPEDDDLADAFRRRAGDPADGAGAGGRACAPLRGHARDTAAARGADRFAAVVLGRRPDRLPDQGLRRPRAGALPRIHRRRDAGVDGPGLRAAAATGLSRRDRAPRELATVAVRRRAAAAHPATGVAPRLRRSAQGCRRRADAAHDAGSSRHGTDGLRRPAGDRRRHPVRVGRARQRDRREARPMIRVLALVACLLTVCITASSAFIRHWQNGVGCEGWPACYRAAQPPARVPSATGADAQGALDAADATIARVPAGDAPAPVRAARALHRVTATLAGVLVLLVVAFGWSTMGGGERI